MAASLPALDEFDRNALSEPEGRTFKEFRKSLTPRWTRVWIDIAAGYFGLGVIFSALVFADRHYPRALLLSAVLGALAFGYVIAYIQLFFHEAAHYNLAKDRKRNDQLATVFVGLMLGQNIKAYRLVHFDHHRDLGTSTDTEHSYFDALNLRFIIESLTGIKVVRVLLSRGKHLAHKAGGNVARERPKTGLILVLGMLVNLAILGAALLSHSWSVLFAWPVGMVVVHPAINAIRQLLEHRSYEADSHLDYSQVPHGAVTRMFGRGPLASTLGGAGFNRHLLHHWEPQISYTRFAELEAFLLKTAAADVVRGATSTYLNTLFRLMRAP